MFGCGNRFGVGSIVPDGGILRQDAKPEKIVERGDIEVGEKSVSVDFSKVTPEMLDAYVKWEPPSLFDADNPTRALGLIRAAFFAGYKEGEVRRNNQ